MAPPSTGASGLHVRYERAGVILDSLPVPWSADAVIVEARVRLPKSAAAEKQDFTLRLSTGGPIQQAEILFAGKNHGPTLVFFRFPPPEQSGALQVYWRDHMLGSADLPILTWTEFTQGLSVKMPTVHANIKGQVVPCRTVVAGQCQALWVSAVLTNSFPLAPVMDVEFNLRIWHGEALLHTIPVHWTTELLRTRETPIAVALPRLRRIGEYRLCWDAARRTLHTLRFRVISKRRFLRALRVTATRFTIHHASGEFESTRSLPQRDGQPLLDGIARITPVFYVCSGEAGMAGRATFTMTAEPRDESAGPALETTEILVIDGPTFLMPGALTAEDLKRIKHIVLASNEGTLGVLPLTTAPAADFTGEGGFSAGSDFLWSAAAEEQLHDRLGKLLEDG